MRWFRTNYLDSYCCCTKWCFLIFHLYFFHFIFNWPMEIGNENPFKEKLMKITNGSCETAFHSPLFRLLTLLRYKHTTHFIAFGNFTCVHRAQTVFPQQPAMCDRCLPALYIGFGKQVFFSWAASWPDRDFDGLSHNSGGPLTLAAWGRCSIHWATQ